MFPTQRGRIRRRVGRRDAGVGARSAAAAAGGTRPEMQLLGARRGGRTAHTVTNGGQPAAHVVGVDGLDDILHVVVGFQYECVFVVGHFQGGGLASFGD